MRFNRIEIVDLQSWKGGEVLDLSPLGLTVLRGPSETGKSTLFRFISRFCTREINSREMFTAYVRKGCARGGLVMSDSETGEKLSFILNNEGKFLTYSDGQSELIDFYTEDEINETLLEQYGILVDDVNNFVVNVFGRDNLSLGVSTSQLLNGAILDRVLIGRDIERIMTYLKNQEEDLRDYLKSNVIKRDYYKTKMHNTAYVEEDFLKYYLNMSKELTTLSKYLSSVEKDVIALKNNKKPTREQPPKQEQELKKMLKLLEMFSAGQTAIGNISRSVHDINEVSARLMHLKDVNRLCEKLQVVSRAVLEIINRKKPKEPECDKPLQELESAVKLLSIMQVITEENDSVSNGLVKRQMLSEKLAKSTKRLQELKIELKICPTCGSEFGG